MLSSRVVGMPLLHHMPKCRAQQSIDQLVNALLERQPSAKASGVRKKKGWFN